MIIQSIFDTFHLKVVNEFFLAKLTAGLIFAVIVFYPDASKPRPSGRGWSSDVSVGTGRSGFRPEGADQKGTPVFGPGGLHLTRKKGDEKLPLVKESLFILTALFLLNPVGEPWYFCWVIPFLCFSPYRSLLLLSCCIGKYKILSYLRLLCLRKAKRLGLRKSHDDWR